MVLKVETSVIAPNTLFKTFFVVVVVVVVVEVTTTSSLTFSFHSVDENIPGNYHVSTHAARQTVFKMRGNHKKTYFKLKRIRTLPITT